MKRTILLLCALTLLASGQIVVSYPRLKTRYLWTDTLRVDSAGKIYRWVATRDSTLPTIRWCIDSLGGLMTLYDATAFHWDSVGVDNAYHIGFLDATTDTDIVWAEMNRAWFRVIDTTTAHFGLQALLRVNVLGGGSARLQLESDSSFVLLSNPTDGNVTTQWVGGAGGTFACTTRIDTNRFYNNGHIQTTGNVLAGGYVQADSLVPNSPMIIAGDSTIVRGLVNSPAFHGPLVGNVTGNASGSSGSCTGNAATADTSTGGATRATLAANSSQLQTKDTTFLWPHSALADVATTSNDSSWQFASTVDSFSGGGLVKADVGRFESLVGGSPITLQSEFNVKASTIGDSVLKIVSGRTRTIVTKPFAVRETLNTDMASGNGVVLFTLPAADSLVILNCQIITGDTFVSTGAGNTVAVTWAVGTSMTTDAAPDGVTQTGLMGVAVSNTGITSDDWANTISPYSWQGSMLDAVNGMTGWESGLGSTIYFNWGTNAAVAEGRVTLKVKALILEVRSVKIGDW